MRQTIRSTVHQESKLRVDREKGVIHNVHLLGVESKNDREYPLDVQRRRADRYEGAKVYVNHAEPEKGEMGRRYEDWIATVRRPDVDPGKAKGLESEVHVKLKHPLAEQFLDDAENRPEQLGMSHVAVCESEYVDGREVITDIEEVLSVDLVTDPATTSGLFITESVEYPMANKSGKKEANKVRRTVRAIKESVPIGTPKRSLFMEMPEDLMSPDMPVDLPAEPATDPGNAMLAAELAAFAAVLEDESLSPQQQLDKLIAIAKAMMEVESGGGESEGGGEGGSGGESTTEEQLASLQYQFALSESRNLLLESNRGAEDAAAFTQQVEILAATPKEKREALLKSWPVNGGGQTYQEHRPSQPPGRAGGGNSQEAADPDTYREGLRKRADKIRTG